MKKSQIQALDRTQPGLPLKQGRAGTFTHDYKRHGTTTLFAALNVSTGDVQHECRTQAHATRLSRVYDAGQARRAARAERACDPGQLRHAQNAQCREWLRRYPRVHFHFTPTSASWLHHAELRITERTRRQLRRLVVNAVAAAITAYFNHRNETPTPFA
jgi:hypothetical protein